MGVERETQVATQLNTHARHNAYVAGAVGTVIVVAADNDVVYVRSNANANERRYLFAGVKIVVAYGHYTERAATEVPSLIPAEGSAHVNLYTHVNRSMAKIIACFDTESRSRLVRTYITCQTVCGTNERLKLECFYRTFIRIAGIYRCAREHQQY